MGNEFWRAVLNTLICWTGPIMEIDQLKQALKSDVPGFSFRFELVTSDRLSLFSYLLCDAHKCSVTGSWLSLLYLFPRTSITKRHKLGGLKTQTFIPPEFWRLDIWNEGVDRSCSLQRLKESILFCLFQLLRGPGIPWFVAGPFQSLPPSPQALHGHLPSVSLHLFSSYKNVSHIGHPPDLIFTGSPLQRAYFQIRSHSQIWAVRFPTYLFRGHNSPYCNYDY